MATGSVVVSLSSCAAHTDPPPADEPQGRNFEIRMSKCLTNSKSEIGMFETHTNNHKSSLRKKGAGSERSWAQYPGKTVACSVPVPFFPKPQHQSDILVHKFYCRDRNGGIFSHRWPRNSTDRGCETSRKWALIGGEEKSGRLR